MAIPKKTLPVESASKRAIQYVGHIRQIDPNLYDCLEALVRDAGSVGDTVNKVVTLLTNAGIGSGKSTGVLKRISLRL